MAPQTELKRAQHVLAASDLAAQIASIDGVRLGAALSLLMPSELERLAAIVYVAAKIAMDEPPAEPKKRNRKNSPAAAVATPATTSPGTAAAGKEEQAENPQPGGLPPCCIAPACIDEALFVRFPSKKPELCVEHKDAPDSEVGKWRYEQSITPKDEAKKRAAALGDKLREVVG